MHFCPFCEIISGEKSSYTIYEDDHTLAFLDINPEVEGHTLIIPRQHVGNLKDLDSNTLRHLMNTVQHVVNHYEAISYCEGANVLMASGVAADQSIDHFHIHILPRHFDDGFDYWPTNKSKTEAQFELHRVQSLLSMD